MLLEATLLPTVRTGTLIVKGGGHLPDDDRPLQVMEHLLALRERQPGGLDSRPSTDQISDLLSVFGAIVCDGDELDAEMHDHSFRC